LHPAGKERAPANPELLQLRRDQLEFQKAKLALRKEELTHQTRSQQRRTIVKSMGKLKVLARPEDIETLYDVAWAFAALRSPLIERGDIITGFMTVNYQWTIRAFPVDFEAIIKASKEIWDRKSSLPPVRPFEPEPAYWPEGDPR
jgi:hypothetical protein